MNCGGMTGLYDAPRLVRELGITQAAAEKMMRRLPKIVPDRNILRKTYVRGEDVEALLDSWTVDA